MRRRWIIGLGGCALLGLVAAQGGAAEPARAAVPKPASALPTPIQNVVIIYQENHSFDNVLGRLCVQDARCDGATTAVVSNGSTITLPNAPDVVPFSPHGTDAQIRAVNGGLMDQFDAVSDACGAAHGYRCHTQFSPEQIPNLSALAREFVISDRTFALDYVPSWGAHVELASGTLNGFLGETPTNGTSGQGTIKGSGCDSLRDALWTDSVDVAPFYVPACVPARDGSGPYRPSPVQNVPTIMDRLTDLGRSWALYSAPNGDTPGQGYLWSICPIYASCLYTDQKNNVHPPDDIITDAQNGNLPNFSILLPNGASGKTSQHNGDSMATGDNWIGRVMTAIMNGPQWSSTAVLITYDDCGCFYDHVPPPPDLGIRLPMVLVSPWAKPAYTDSNVASFGSLLSFAEWVLDVPPLGTGDVGAYDYHESFDFTQSPLRPARMATTVVPQKELDWLAAHPVDEDDPT